MTTREQGGRRHYAAAPEGEGGGAGCPREISAPCVEPVPARALGSPRPSVSASRATSAAARGHTGGHASVAPRRREIPTARGLAMRKEGGAGARRVLCCNHCRSNYFEVKERLDVLSPLCYLGLGPSLSCMAGPASERGVSLRFCGSGRSRCRRLFLLYFSCRDWITLCCLSKLTRLYTVVLVAKE